MSVGSDILLPDQILGPGQRAVEKSGDAGVVTTSVEKAVNWARSNAVPHGRVVPVERVRSEVPADHPRVDETTRRAALSRRREAAWNRFL